ncbi:MULTISPECIES: DUF4333 domain-containing protein [Gordonia]|uniref:DUF4333 domain-containing protein n=1 Tax=Gordonia TaxID=2053 RepID=UPI003264C2F6
MLIRRIAAVAVGIVAAPVLASCSFSIGGDSIDMDKLTSAITDEFNSTLAPFGYRVQDVTCDDPGKDPGDGTEFNCVATADGTAFNVTATVAQPDVNFKSVERAYDMKTTSKKLAPAVSEKIGRPITVDCGSGLKAVAPQQSFTCSVADSAGNTGTLTYHVTEAAEQDRWEVE